MSCASAERRGSRRRSARCCGSIFERVRAGLKARKLITHAELFSSLTAAISKNKNVVFDFAIVDEAQDISVAHLCFFAALGGGRPNALFFPATSGSASSSSPSPGRRWAWTFEDVRAPCALTTAPPTKFACRRTACSARW